MPRLCSLDPLTVEGSPETFAYTYLKDSINYGEGNDLVITTLDLSRRPKNWPRRISI
jgi:hypothetical protein